ncbi:MAG: hypothetical protein KJ593_03195 [Candidatus Omnitrophica bacterium]|nr:hypothetical protein [Candidatus Omnitrophota bacterium]
MNIKKQPPLDFLKKNIFTTGVFIKTIVAIALLFFYAFVSSRFLPQGINYVFVTRLYQWLLMLMAMLYFVFFICFYCTRHGSFKYINSVEGFYIGDLFLLLLPMIPIVRYIILNQDSLSTFDSIMVFIIFFAVSFILTFLVPIVVGIIGSRKILMIVGLSFSYVLFNMASLASDFSWHLSGSLKIQFIVLVVFFTISLVIYSLNRKFLNIVVAVLFAVSTLTALISFRRIRNEIKGLIFPVDSPKIYAYTKGKEMKRKPDCFLLTFDAYAANETMLKYGIDNNAQEDYLIQNGFHIYKGIYSLAPGSKPSMDCVFNIRRTSRQSWLSALMGPRYSDFYGAGFSGNGAVQNILKENGYETFGIFSSYYFFREVGSFYDQSFPTKAVAFYKLLAKSIFEGEFRFDVELSKKNYFKYLAKKNEVLASTTSKPRFLYTHNEFPNHSQNSGRCLGNEIELYKERLVKANKEMREDIETIKKYNPNAIIIVNGDHGPFLTKNCFFTSRNNQYDKSEIDQLDIQDRYGVLLAIKWPKDANIDHDKIKVLQDIFPSVFAYLYDDASILNSRVERLTFYELSISGVRVRNGIIVDGKDDGKLLFDSMKER